MKRLLSAALTLGMLCTAGYALGAEKVPGWFMSGGGRNAYEVVLDRAVKHSGRASAQIHAINKDKPEGYGTLMQSFSAAPYVGKRVRLSAWIRTEGTTGRTDFWARVQGAGSPGDGPGLGGGHKNLPEKSDWTRYDFVFDVPDTGIALQFGVGLMGPGNLWVDDVQLEEVPKSTPLDDGSSMRPVNLDFEE